MDDNKKLKFDTSSVIAHIDKVKKMRAAKPRRKNSSPKPLQFERNPDDSPLKDEIIRRINEKGWTYAELYDYCTKLKGGDERAGATAGSNIIIGLRKRHTMIDTTFSILCDFLGLDIVLVERQKDTEEDSDNDFDIFEDDNE